MSKKRQYEFIKKIKGLKPFNFLALSIAGLINAIGVILLLGPIGLLDGGLSGTSLFLDRITPNFLTISFFLVILNFPFYIFANKKIGFHFTIYSLFSILIYSIFALLLKKQFSIAYIENESPIGGKDYLLCSIFGGLLSGIGSGITIRFGGALDGIEVMAVLVAKKIGLTVGTFVMTYNILLYFISAIVFKSWIIPLYSIIAYFVAIKTVDLFVEGLDKAKAVMIISKKWKQISSNLSFEFGRGITLIEAKGFYSDQSKKLIYCVVNRFEIPKLKRIIKEIDIQAFVAINDVSDTLGNRFKIKIK